MNVVMLAISAAIVLYVVCDAPPWHLGDAAPEETVADEWLGSLIVVDAIGHELELPLVDGWDADAILTTVAQIEAL
jgi:hypothetical protein